MEGMIGEIRMFAGNFAPKNWSMCNGATIQIASNTALFSILGTTYGGNGTTTFLLPNLQDRVAVGQGSGPGLSTYVLGQASGSDTVTLTLNEMPAHMHVVTGSYAPGGFAGGGGDASPAGGYPADSNFGDVYIAASNASMAPVTVNTTIGPMGGNVPHQNDQPFLGMNYVICMFGIFPVRN